MISKPPNLSELPYGTVLQAGLGTSIIIADFDFETYSSAGFVWCDKTNKWLPPHGAREKGLKTVGTVVYTEHPDAEILCMAYDLKDGKGRRQWTPTSASFPTDLFTYLQSGQLLEAWNISFEYWVWTNICVPKYGFPALCVSQLRCAQAKARAYSLPASLDEAGRILNITHKKDPRGKQLLNKFSIPRNPTKTNTALRNLLNHDDPDRQALYNYNLRDIEAEAEISSLVPDLSSQELEFWQCDQAINRRGVAVDMKVIDGAIKIIEAAYQKYNIELQELTDGAVTSASQLPKMKKWINENLPTVVIKEQDGESGVPFLLRKEKYIINSLSEETVEQLLTSDTLSPDVRRVLEIRQLAGSAAVKKLYALKNQASKHNRLHNLFVYYGARTGRHSGVGVQPQNLPNSGPDVNQCENCEQHYTPKRLYCPWCGCDGGFSKRKEWNAKAANDAIEVISTGSLAATELHFDNPIATVSACLRGMFIAAPEHVLVCSDYKSIEAVVLAELVGETWRQEVFRTHGMIYEMSASKITGISFQEYMDYKKRTGNHHPTRKTIGKVAELASGYGGWIGAWKQFGADEFFSDKEIKEHVIAWREASPNIVKFWHEIEHCAVQAVLNPGNEYGYNGIVYKTHNEVLYCRLFSGRHLTYHKPRLAPNRRPGREGTLELSYEGWNSNPQMGTPGWTRLVTYGGRLTENIVQAVSRDIFAHAIVNLERENYSIVLHTHDEIVCEIGSPHIAAVENLERIMSTMPSWATEWPVYAKDGWVAHRYSK